MCFNGETVCGQGTAIEHKSGLKDRGGETVLTSIWVSGGKYVLSHIHPGHNHRKTEKCGQAEEGANV